MHPYFGGFLLLALVVAATALCIYLNRCIFKSIGTATVVYSAPFAIFIFSRIAFESLSYVDAEDIVREPGFVLLVIGFLFLIFGAVGWVVTAVQAVACALRERHR